MKITGNTVLMAGGTSGIGLELARRFHEAGNKVILAGRNREAIDRITAEHEGIEGAVVDITDKASIRHLFETVTAEHPELDTIVAMAGIMRPEPVLDPGRWPRPRPRSRPTCWARSASCTPSLRSSRAGPPRRSSPSPRDWPTCR
ncbi:hypothetical protein GCM10029992_48790 [Glycomyces albus]